MPLDLENPRDIKRLRLAMTHSLTKLGPFKRKRIAAMAQYAGKHYGPNSKEQNVDRIPVNKIETLVDVFGRQVAANNPAVLVSTYHEELIPAAASFEIRLNRLMSELDMVGTLREAVTDAIFCMGIVRIGSSVMNPTEQGFDVENGGPYARSISIDDFVWDMRVHREQEVDYMGNRYRMPLDELRDSGLYRPDDLDSLIHTEPNEGGGLSQEEEVDRDLTLSLGTSVEFGDYRKYVDLWDIWLPGPNVIVTMPDKGPDIALRVAPFDGPEGGPYVTLRFGRVPNQLMPKSPVMAAMDLHMFINAAYRKIFRQAERHKEVPWYKGEAAEDMQRLIEAPDGEVVRVDHDNAVGSYKSGGAAPQSIALAMHADRLFGKQFANLDLLGGISPGAGTLGQTEMLAGNANKLIADMQDSFTKFTKRVVQNLAWYEWTDPLREDVIVKAPGELDIVELWAPETREGDFVQYDVDIEPYSMQHHSPQSRLQSLMNIYQQILAQGQPMMNQQGVGIDWPKFINTIKKYSNLPELGEILRTLSEDEMERVRTASEDPQKAPTTERINTRVNKTQGKDLDQDMMMRFLNRSERQSA